MKTPIFIFLLLINTIGLFCQEKELYNDIVYNESRIATKQLGATYKSIGKAIPNNNRQTIQRIKKTLGFIPTTSISFSYQGDEYYIPVYSDLLNCGIFYSLQEGDPVVLEVLFLKSCLDHKQRPFAIVRTLFREKRQKNFSSYWT